MSDVEPGDIVLRNGRAEEVDGVFLDRYWTKGASPYANCPALSEATPLGINTRDGWKVHHGSERPEGVEAKDRVEWVWANGERSKGPAGSDAGWRHRGDQWRIVAYRIVRRAAPPAPSSVGAANHHKAQQEVNTMQSAALRSAPDRDAEVLAVAAELRSVLMPRFDVDSNLRCFTVKQIKQMADRLDPPAPQPLKVGDRVRLMTKWEGSKTGRIFGYEHGDCAIVWDEGCYGGVVPRMAIHHEHSLDRIL